MTICRIFLALTVAFFCMKPAVAKAKITFINGKNEANGINGVYGWTQMAPPEGPINIPPPEGPMNSLTGPWSGIINTKAPPPGTPGVGSVEVYLQHFDGQPPADPGHGPNQKGTLLKTRVLNPRGRTSRVDNDSDASQVMHGNHTDYFRLEVFTKDFVPSTPTATGLIGFTGIHLPRATVLKKKTIPSVTPFKKLNETETGRDTKVTPNYRREDGSFFAGPVIQDGLIAFDEHTVFEPFASSFQEGILAGYTITMNSDNTSNTLVGFTGLVDEIPSLLDLSPLIEVSVGFEEFFFPLLSSTTNDIFIGIDLGDWLISETTVEPLEIFDFTNGVNDKLPGIFIGLTPVIPTADGFTALTPYNGLVINEGSGDGRNKVPESTSIFSLLALGTIGALSTLKCRLKPSKSMQASVMVSRPLDTKH